MKYLIPLVVIFFATLGLGCASPNGTDDDANKVWMRAGSTANVEFDENTCRASSATNADFRLCMMSAGWKLETPPDDR